MQQSFRVIGILACLMWLAGSGAMAQVGIFPNAVTLDAAAYGHVAVAGSATESNGVYTLKGNGRDIWDNGDEAFFIYKELSGPNTISAKVKWVDARGSNDGGNDWAKIGVMIREKGNVPESKHYWIELRCGAGNPALGDRVDTQWRASEGGTSSNIQVLKDGKDIGSPAGIWVRATRLPDNVFVSQYSFDGKTWYFAHSIKTITMQDTVAYGLIITSHTEDTQLVTAEVSDVYLGRPIGIASSTENWELFK
ncbi:MAG TPA: hypothetical protein PK878_02910 [bacterium]|nr:hypothetical protein [Candidatus Omnitrophota bacterium]HOJ59212.1 hypothetical protein [bacterium]HOL94735.1 hypothetical protein [bacterium]HPO99403.1 hypothetical protein [bacterium]